MQKMTKVEKLRYIVDEVLAEIQEDNMIIAMLRPILTNFITQMKDEDIDGLIKVFKAIIAYLEKDDEELVKKMEEAKKKEGDMMNEEDKKVIPFSR